MNSIHRRKILDAINSKCLGFFFFFVGGILDLDVTLFNFNGVDEKQLMENSLWNGYADEKLDGFISYRRSNGSEFARYMSRI